MKRLSLLLTTCVVLAGALVGPGIGTASAAVGDELLLNPGLEAATSGAPTWWTPSSWGDHTGTSTWSTDAHTGSRSVRVDITGYDTQTPAGDGGDAKWMAEPIDVNGGVYYTFSDWYKSDRNSAVSVEYWLPGESTDDDGHWANLFSGIAPASDWTQYKTGFTMPAGAEKAVFVHFIAGVGYLQTDDYSVKQQATPPGFDQPIVSLTFDDGSETDYTNAIPRLDAKGFKSTQYIPTQGLVTSPHDEFLMDASQVSAMAKNGHEIGGHSVTHPDLTTLSGTALADEFTDKQTLEAIPGVGTVRNFAYPFGSYDAHVIQAAKDAGYQTGRSVEEGYNSRLDFEPFDIRVQNMTPDVTIDTFKSWINYAKDHNYWLVIVYHEVVPEGSPRCAGSGDGGSDAVPDVCLGDYDTTIPNFQAQLDAISGAGLGSNVKTVQQALSLIDDARKPVAGTVKVSPASPTTNQTVTAAPSGFSDPDGDALTYHYTWRVNGTVVAGATGSTFDLAQAGHGDAGDDVSVEIYATDPDGHTSSAVSDSVKVAATKGPAPDPSPAPAANPTPTPSPSPSPNPGRGSSTSPVDRVGPTIKVTGVAARKYKVGRTLRITFSVRDGSGVARSKATLRIGKGKNRTLKKGAKVRLTRSGTYVLRITATDSKGNTTTRTVRFRVTRR